MTESEWQSCTDPKPMLDYLQGRASDRKLRLFACACCRLLWRQLTDARGRSAVEVAERFADGLVAARVRGRAFTAAREPTRHVGAPAQNAYHCAAYAAHASPARAARGASANAPYARGRWVAGPEGPVFRRWKGAPLCPLLRDIFGNPFQPPPHIDPAWLVRNDGTVKKLAEAIYEGRSFDRLPILADALEEASCDDAKLLGHLRGTGPHVKGCWVLDLALGKE